MPIKASELPDLIGKLVTVQVDLTRSNPDGDEDYREVTGKMLHATAEAVAIQPPRGRMELIEVSDIIDVDVQGRPRRLVRRWLDPIPTDGVRQHLLDRHGVPFRVVHSMSPQDAEMMHGAIDHSALGHEHGVKPPRQSGRTRYARPED